MHAPYIMGASPVVIDLAAIPWPTVMILLGAAWVLLEARLSKAGYTKKDQVAAAAAEAGFVKKEALDGLGARLDAKFVTADSEREMLSRAALVIRTDLDDTRDRVTRGEMTMKAVEARVDEAIIKPLGRIEDKVDILVAQQSHNQADIEALKSTVRRLEAQPPLRVASP